MGCCNLWYLVIPTGNESISFPTFQEHAYTATPSQPAVFSSLRLQDIAYCELPSHIYLL